MRRAGPCAIPVHGELSDQGDVRVVRGGLILIVQEVQVGSVDGEPLSPELVTQVVLIQLRELLLELEGRKGGVEQEGKPRGAPEGAGRAPPSPESVSHWTLWMGHTEKDSIAVCIFLCNLF